MTGICKSFALPCCAKRLTWATSSPDFPVVTPAGVAQGVAPDADSCEKVALCEPLEVARSYIFNAPFINNPVSYVTCCYQVAQPLRSVGVELVVVGCHGNKKTRSTAGYGFRRKGFMPSRLN